MRGLTNSRSGGGSNLNLLDNWDFSDPVNQRGKSMYADEGYTIDRWRKIGGTVSINNNRLNLSGAHSSISYIADIRQPLDSGTISAIAGKTVTLSVDCVVNSISGEFYISLANDTKKEYPAPVFTSSFSRKIISCTQNIPSNWGSADSVRFTLGTNGTKVNADIYAVKLELGEVSTLKNDVLGVNYAKELLKCQKYFERSRYQVTYGTALNTNVLEHTDNYFYKKEKRIDECIFTVDPVPSQPLQVYDVSDGKLELVSNCILVPPTTYNNYCYSPRIESPNNKFITGRRYLARIGDNAYSISADL